MKHSRDIGIVDSAETLALSKEFSIPGCVRVSDGRGGMPKVTLIHHSGSFCEVYLDGGNIHTWVLANGGEVFYSPDGVPLNQHTLNDWRTPRNPKERSAFTHGWTSQDLEVDDIADWGK